jgi:hypothetical protein
MNPAGIRILEIGDHSHFKHTYFEQTKLLWTGRKAPRSLSPRDYIDCTPGAFLRAMKRAADGEFDIVIAYAGQRSPWHPRYWFRALFGKSPLSASIRVFGVSWIRRTRAPIVVLDMHDIPTIHPSNFLLLDLARFYFKRELPVDHWQSFSGTAHANLPTLRIRRDPKWQLRIAKLRPISLQAPLLELGLSEADVFANKKHDIFFAGDVESNSTVRSAGLRSLRKLSDLGIKVDIALDRQPTAEYYRRMSQAWLAWSPSGLGWDCYRHYEAPQCLAVPVINYPTIFRHQPLEAGVHAIYYAPEDDGLSNAVLSALPNKEKLRTMAKAGCAHVRANHAGPVFCDRILNMTVGTGGHGTVSHYG